MISILIYFPIYKPHKISLQVQLDFRKPPLLYAYQSEFETQSEDLPAEQTIVSKPLVKSLDLLVNLPIVK